MHENNLYYIKKDEQYFMPESRNTHMRTTVNADIVAGNFIA
jgi:hypothetical protein